MPAATNKQDLLSAFDRDYQKLADTLSRIDETSANLAAPDETATIKGVIAHRTHWIGLYFGWVESGRAGGPVHVPAKGVKWNQLKPYNEEIYEAAAERSWADVLAKFQAAVDRLRAFIDDESDQELYQMGLYDWLGKWTLGRYAEASGPSHFRSANSYIRKTLRAAGIK